MTQEQMLKALRKIFHAEASLFVDFDGKEHYLDYEIFKQVHKDCDVTKEEYEAVLEWVEDEKGIETVDRELKVLETIKDIYGMKIMTDTKKIIERYEMKNNAYLILGDEKHKPSNLLESDYRKAKLLKEWLGKDEQTL